MWQILNIKNSVNVRKAPSSGIIFCFLDILILVLKTCWMNVILLFRKFLSSFPEKDVSVEVFFLTKITGSRIDGVILLEMLKGGLHLCPFSSFQMKTCTQLWEKKSSEFVYNTDSLPLFNPRCSHVAVSSCNQVTWDQVFEEMGEVVY